MPCPLYSVGTPVWYMFMVLCPSFSYCSTALPKVVSRKKIPVPLHVCYKSGIVLKKIQCPIKGEMRSASCDYNFDISIFCLYQTITSENLGNQECCGSMSCMWEFPKFFWAFLQYFSSPKLCQCSQITLDRNTPTCWAVFLQFAVSNYINLFRALLGRYLVKMERHNRSSLFHERFHTLVGEWMVSLLRTLEIPTHTHTHTPCDFVKCH